MATLLSSAFRRIGSFLSDSHHRHAHIYYCRDAGEYLVRFYADSVLNEGADYFTSDKVDAFGTARVWVHGNH